MDRAATTSPAEIACAPRTACAASEPGIRPAPRSIRSFVAGTNAGARLLRRPPPRRAVPVATFVLRRRAPVVTNPPVSPACAGRIRPVAHRYGMRPAFLAHRSNAPRVVRVLRCRRTRPLHRALLDRPRRREATAVRDTAARAATTARAVRACAMSTASAAAACGMTPAQWKRAWSASSVVHVQRPEIAAVRPVTSDARMRAVRIASAE
jgi:hypothetical protein